MAYQRKTVPKEIKEKSDSETPATKATRQPSEAQILTEQLITTLARVATHKADDLANNIPMNEHLTGTFNTLKQAAIELKALTK